VLFSHGSNKAFLVPASCRASRRNGNSISADMRGRERSLILLFSDNLVVVLDCLTLQDKHSICTLSVILK
jgi:hypothetical protein